MQIPRYTISGENLKKYILDTLRSILDYLHASRVRPGYGINVDETPSGTIISLAKSASSGSSSLYLTGGTSSASGLIATVSGGTASISVSGSYPLVLVGKSGVNITGSTNGELEISLTGGTGSVGFPDYSSPLSSVLFGTDYGAYAYPVWVIGYAETVYDGTNENGFVRVVMTRNGNPVQNLTLFGATVEDTIDGNRGYVQTQILVPIPAGITFSFDHSDVGGGTISANIYPCIP